MTVHVAIWGPSPVRALQLLDSAEGCLPSDAVEEVATLAFIRLKVALDLRDAAMAEAQVLRAACCNETDTTVLEASTCDVPLWTSGSSSWSRRSQT